MNKIFTKTIIGQLLILLFSLISISCDEAFNAPTTISLRSRSYSFNESLPPSGVLAGDDSEGSLRGASGAIKSLTVKMSVSLKVPVEEVSFLDIPGVLKVSTRNQDPAVWEPQNYPSFPMPDGTVPVLEAALTLHSDIGAGEVRDLVVGIPIALLEEPAGKHDVVLDFTGVRWSMFVDGTLYYNDFAIGYPVPEKDLSWNINPSVVNIASLWVRQPSHSKSGRNPVHPGRYNTLPRGATTPGWATWSPANTAGATTCFTSTTGGGTTASWDAEDTISSISPQ